MLIYQCCGLTRLSFKRCYATSRLAGSKQIYIWLNQYLLTDQQSNVECSSKYIYDANERLYNCVCSLSPARVVAGSISNHNIYRPSFKTSVFTARFSCHGCRTMGCFWPLTHEWVLQKRIIIPSFIHLNVSDSILPLRPESWCGSKSNCSSVIMIRERGCLLQLTAFPPPPHSLVAFSLVNWSKVSRNNSCHFQLRFLLFRLPVCLLRFCLSGWVPRLKLTHVSLRAFHPKLKAHNLQKYSCHDRGGEMNSEKKKIKIKRHTQVSERDRAVLFISLKLLSTRSCFRSTMLQLTHRHKHPL